MIQSKEDYKRYLEADKLRLGYKNVRRPRFMTDEIWKFERLMRKYEYYNNCKKGIFAKLYTHFLHFRYKMMSERFNYSIPINTFDEGLSLAHIGTIVINGATHIGKNCRMHVCVNIGTKAGTQNTAPQLGDNIYIGPGVKMFGAIQIADNIAIGANAVVNKSFTEPNITIAGVPAKKISDKNSAGLIPETKEGEY